MSRHFFQFGQAGKRGAALILAGLVCVAGAAQAEPQHGIAMYGDPALPPDFVALPHANPDAPNGGSITLANTGSFDSLNPYIQKGNVPWQLRFLTHESLMGRSRNEPFALYGLLAESPQSREPGFGRVRKQQTAIVPGDD
ncbi:MAG: hypothetical protein AAGF36_16320, partial [Pseudomonadota bacterium]